MEHWGGAQTEMLRLLLLERKTKLTFIRITVYDKKPYIQVAYSNSKKRGGKKVNNSIFNTEDFTIVSKIDYPEDSSLQDMYNDIQEAVTSIRSTLSEELCIRVLGNVHTKILLFFFPETVEDISVHSCRMCHGENKLNFTVLVEGISGESNMYFEPKSIPSLLKNPNFAEELIPLLAAKVNQAQKMVKHYGNRLSEIYDILDDKDKLLIQTSDGWNVELEDDS